MSRHPDPTLKISLLRAAEQVYVEKGVLGATVEDITRRAGVSKGAFYLHFENKEAAVKQVVESFLARCGAHCAPPSPDLPRDPDALLAHWHSIDVGLFEFLWQNRNLLGILGGCQGEYQYLVQAFRGEMTQTSQAWIAFFTEREMYRPGLDADVVSRLIFGAYNGLFEKMLESPVRPPLELWLLETLELHVRGLGTPAFIEACIRYCTKYRQKDRSKPRQRGLRTVSPEKA